MIFNVKVKTEGENLQPGDLVYHTRKLLRVERVVRPRKRNGLGTFKVKFRIIGKINLDRQLRQDRA